MLEVWTECIMDIVKTIPILFVVYLVISWMENHMDAVTRVVTSTEPAGPVIGALIGAIPQCGISGAAAASAGSATAAGSGVCGFSGASGGSGRGSTYCCGFASGLGVAFLRRRLPPACPLRGQSGTGI